MTNKIRVKPKKIILEKNNPKNRLKVLFLASWYPNDKNPISGIFIKRHAEAVSKFCDVVVLFVIHDLSLKCTKITKNWENGVMVYRLYIPVDLSSFVIIRNFKNRILHNFYIQVFKVFRNIVKNFGYPNIVQVNVMFTDMTELGIFAILIQHLFHIPYIIVEHSTTFLSNNNNFREKLKIRILLKLSRKVMPVSNVLKISLESIQEANFFIINNVVDTDFFKPPSKKANNRVNQIIHVSLLRDSHKNISGIIQAVGFLRKVRTDFELHIVGEGLDKETLIQLSNQIQGIEKYIFFHGKVTDETLLSIYQNADLFILNSNFETFGCVLIEAISCGVPVISTRCGGPDGIVTQETGVLINIGDMEQLVEAINNILDNKDKYNSNIMHSYAVDNYGYINVGKTFMNIYEEILKNYDE